MKIEKLTENKIRIIINFEELESKNINIKHITKNDKTVNLLFQFILDEAEKQVGFNVKNCKLLIEALSTSEDYIVFTLTKYKDNSIYEKKSKKLTLKRRNLNFNCKNAIYKFNTFEDFCTFCTYYKNSKLNSLKNIAKNISLYEYNNFYYLMLSTINSNLKNSSLFYISISEFSNLVSSSILFRSKLLEHGNIIFKSNAIKKGIEYFVNI